MEKNNKLWSAVLGELELTLSRGNYVTWFKNSHLIDVDGSQVLIGVSNIFVKNQLETKYRTTLNNLLLKNGVKAESINFRVVDNAKYFSPEQNDAEVEPELASIKIVSKRDSSHGNINSLSHEYRQGLNERYTFDSFVVGSGNELAWAACQGVVKNLGKKYNPLYLYGGVGIGKTHLIQAIGNSVLKSNPKARVVYATTEQFVQEFVDALRFKKTTDFAKSYRSADVLIVDDLQFIAGKEKVQEEFFHTFNALHQANKQLVLSSDQPPQTIPTLENRLKSRFASGMMIDMQNPDLETRCAILQLKASETGIKLDQETAEYIASVVKTNIRELEGELNRLLAFCEVRDLEPDVEIAKGLMGKNDTRPKHVSAKQIIEASAKYFQIEMKDIMSPKRDRDIVVPRQIAMYMLRSELHLSFPKIAEELGRKDHTTAMHSVEKIERESHLDPLMRSKLSEIRDMLYV